MRFHDATSKTEFWYALEVCIPISELNDPAMSHSPDGSLEAGTSRS